MWALFKNAVLYKVVVESSYSDMGTWPPNGYFSHTELLLSLLCSTGGKWEENGRVKSGAEKREKGRNQEVPTFARFSGPDFAQPFYSSLFTTNWPYSTPRFFLWTGHKQQDKRKNSCDEVWERKARERRKRHSPPDFAIHSSLAFFFASRRTKQNKDCLQATLPFFLSTGQHVRTCLNISFLLNLLATGSWYTALGQELILTKMSFSLSSDTGNKLKTKDEK